MNVSAQSVWDGMEWCCIEVELLRAASEKIVHYTTWYGVESLVVMQIM